jgi:uncharacterized OsmC-like protein
MPNRHFHLRLQASYEAGENNENIVTDLSIHNLVEGAWEPLQLDLRTPGFLMYMNALFSCQHLYLRANCAERDLMLESARGELKLEASEDWVILDIEVSFDCALSSGTVTEEALAYITDRMHHCPVSTNLPRQVPMAVAVNLA